MDEGCGRVGTLTERLDPPSLSPVLERGVMVCHTGVWRVTEIGAWGMILKSDSLEIGDRTTRPIC